MHGDSRTVTGFGRASSLAAVLVIAVACAPVTVGGNTRSAVPRPSRAVPSRQTTATPKPAIRPTASTDPISVEAVVGDHFFDPQVIVVKVGMTVTWQISSGTHDVTARDGSFHSPILFSSWSHTFDQPGRFLFFCSVHPEMRGEVVVEPAN